MPDLAKYKVDTSPNMTVSFKLVRYLSRLKIADMYPKGRVNEQQNPSPSPVACG